MSADADRAPVNVVYYGSERPLPERHVVRAGPFRAVLEGADLRYVTLGDDLVILRLYAAVRDRSWGTIAPVFTRYELRQDDRSFALTFEAEHVSGGEQGVDFAWRGSITGSDDGTITLEMDGAARSAFWRNRIGWCVLHPMELAGQPVEIRGGNRSVQSAFPKLISPDQPFLDIEEMTHGTGGGHQVRITFAGDVFETEDQRNWTDASFKTYSTPLRLPYPVRLEAGDHVRQAVTVSVVGTAARTATGDTEAPPVVRVGAELGPVLPQIGLATPGHGQPLSAEAVERFRAMHLGHLHHNVDLAEPTWRERLHQVAREAAELSCELVLEVLTADDGSDFGELISLCPELAAPVARIAVFPRSGVVSTDEVLRAARAARAEAGSDVPIGGGSRAYFTQLNRAVPAPELLDFVIYAVNPQVHAFDNASMVETLAAQEATVATAKAITGDRPVIVGPITLLPRINPDAVPTSEKPLSGTLPPTVDVRQPSLFAAGWTIGSVRHLGNAGVAALTYYETTGWRGVFERSDHVLRVPAFHSRPGMAFPVYHALADIGEFARGRIAPVDVFDPLSVEALALTDVERFRLLLANLTDRAIDVPVSLPPVTDLDGEPWMSRPTIRPRTIPIAFARRCNKCSQVGRCLASSSARMQSLRSTGGLALTRNHTCGHWPQCV